MISSSSYEDDFNILIEGLSKTISTFNTLSREQAEIAILDTTSKIKEGESLILKLEEELDKNHNQEEILEERKKLKLYKGEFNDIVNKFKEIQNNYINRKTKNALIDDEPKMKNDLLLSNEERKNNFPKKSKEQFQNNVNIGIKNEQNIFENNIGNISGVNNGPNISEDAFDNYQNKSKKKKRCLIIGLCITFILIVTFVVVILIESKK